MWWQCLLSGGWRKDENCPLRLLFGVLKVPSWVWNTCQRQANCPKPSKHSVFRSLKRWQNKTKESETADSPLGPIPCSKSCVRGGRGGGDVLLNPFLFWAQVHSVFRTMQTHSARETHQPLFHCSAMVLLFPFWLFPRSWKAACPGFGKVSRSGLQMEWK